MFETRLLLAGAIVVGCTFCGKSVAGASNRRAALLSDLSRSLDILQIQIVRVIQPLNAALRETGNSLFKRVASEIETQMDVRKAWKSALIDLSRRGEYADSLRATEIAALEELFSALGQGTREGQAALIGCAAETIRICSKEAVEEAARNNRLYTSIGALTGLSIAMMIV